MSAEGNSDAAQPQSDSVYTAAAIILTVVGFALTVYVTVAGAAFSLVMTAISSVVFARTRSKMWLGLAIFNGLILALAIGLALLTPVSTTFTDTVYPNR